MPNTKKEFLVVISNQIPSIKQEILACEKEWSPDVPPITILFGNIGTHIGKALMGWNFEQKREIFTLIERGMNSSDFGLREAVATGLIEALVTYADENPKIWEELKKLFGTASLGHALAWRNFKN